MPPRFFFLAVLHLLGSLVRHGAATSPCRCFPDEPCWPSPQQWIAFNATVNGNLIATIPIGSACHPNSAFSTDTASPEACAALLSSWTNPKTHYTSSSSPMSAWWANSTCSPFAPQNDATPCNSLGPLVHYAVNVTSAQDVQATLAFVRAHSIRLVIRNTGHDFLGKSTGAGAIALWTHHLKDTQVEDYHSHWYTGPALRIGAGVQGHEAMAAAHAHNMVVVTGNCQSVGLAGGYAQGGGHGQLASRFGLGADQVVEWNVVTASGEVVTATPAQHEDLYWALCGGGGGTFGVVLGAVVKLYPELRTASAMLRFSLTKEDAAVEQDRARFWDVVRVFVVDTLPLLDIGGMAIWSVGITPSPFADDLLTFAAHPAVLPGGDSKTLHGYLTPTLNLLEGYGMDYDFEIHSFSSFHASYSYTTPWQNITESHLGSRLIPRSTVQTNATSLITALQEILDQTDGSVFGITGISLNVSQTQSRYHTAVHPAWRDAAMALVIGTEYNYTDRATNLRRHKLMTNILLPTFDAVISADSGAHQAAAYLNEADWNELQWQQVFYGKSYARLLQVKREYDPEGMFCARTAVGSEEWVEGVGGRLCRVDG